MASAWLFDHSEADAAVAVRLPFGIVVEVLGAIGPPRPVLEPIRDPDRRLTAGDHDLPRVLNALLERDCREEGLFAPRSAADEFRERDFVALTVNESRMPDP